VVVITRFFGTLIGSFVSVGGVRSTLIILFM